MSTDSEIIRASREEPLRFGEIFERHAASVERFIASRVGPQAKDDVLSETFLVAFRRRSRFDESFISARPWLFGIATRLIRKHRAVEAAHWRSYAAVSGAGEWWTSADVDTASDRVDAAARVRELAPHIAALTPGQRETLFLYAWGDLTYEEIARALDVPVGTVRSRLSRIRQRLSQVQERGAVAPSRRRDRSPSGEAVGEHGLVGARA